MATRIDDGVVIFLLHALEAHCLVELSFGVGIIAQDTQRPSWRVLWYV